MSLKTTEDKTHYQAVRITDSSSQEREKMKTMKIHEKMTYSTKVKAKQKGFRKALQKEEEEENRKQATDEERLKALQECLLWKTAIKKGREQLLSL